MVYPANLSDVSALRVYVKLYRTAVDEKHAWVPGGFWTPMKEYARAMHPNYPMFCAKLKTSATRRRMARDVGANRRDIRKLRGRVDVIVFQAWDAPTTEYVVLRPKKVLRYC